MSFGCVEPGVEHRFERVKQILGRVGRRLRRDGDRWCVFPDGDRRRRPLLCMDQAMLGRLIAAGVVTSDESGGYRLGEDVSSRRAVAVGCLAVSGGGGGRPGFAGLVERARDGLGPLTVAQARVGVRYQVDVEMASLASPVTMNWDFVRSDGSRCPPDGVQRGVRARRRLGIVSRLVDARDLALIHCACVEERTLAALEHRFALPGRTGGVALSAALERLRRVYDGRIAQGEAVDISLN